MAQPEELEPPAGFFVVLGIFIFILGFLLGFLVFRLKGTESSSNITNVAEQRNRSSSDIQTLRELREMILANGRQIWRYKANAGSLPNSPEPEQRSFRHLEVLILSRYDDEYYAKLVLRGGDADHRYRELGVSYGRPTIHGATSNLLKRTATTVVDQEQTATRDEMDDSFCGYNYY